MEHERLFLIGEIAETLAKADDQTIAERGELNSRISNYSRKELLRGAVLIDGRKSRAYPIEEVYRARLFSVLNDFHTDARLLRLVSDEGDRFYNAKTRPPSMQGHGKKYVIARGLFLDSIRGISLGEKWSLRLTVSPPLGFDLAGYDPLKKISIRFTWDDAPNEENELHDLMDRWRYGEMVIDLCEIYRGMFPLIGAPAI